MTSATVRVEKATSDLLIGPDWTLNMDICDSINSDHWHAKDVVKAVKKRLQHKNPRVQFLALTLLETMIKNCGDYIHSQVVERDILQEMIKIVKKKTDMQVRDKILVLLDSWQEAFGGPGGKYPQYYWAFAELRQSGVQFPQRSAESSLIFTPVTHPALVHGHPQAGHGMPSNSSLRLDEAMASEMANLSLSDLDTIQSVMDLLSDMLKAIDPNDREAVKDDLITDLVSQCRSNQKKLVQMLNTTGDEELLGQGLALNDSLQSVLTKHDAIASGSPLPAEIVETLPGPSTPVSSALVVTNRFEDEEEEEDDEFAQLARRNSKGKAASQSTSAEGGVHPSSANHSDATTATDVESSADASLVSSTALALPDPPAPLKTISKESEMIDLLSITLSTNPSPPRSPVAPPTVSNQNASPENVAANKQGHPYNPQSYAVNPGYIPYNNYVAPWAQPQHQPQPQPQPQPQVPQFSSSYPPPPWEATASANPNPYMSTTSYRFPASSVNYSAATPSNPAPSPAYVPMRVPGPPQQYTNSYGVRGNATATTPGETRMNASPRQSAPATATRPFVPSYRLFEDLIDLRNADGSVKTSSSTPKLSGTSNQGMIGGRK